MRALLVAALTLSLGCASTKDSWSEPPTWAPIGVWCVGCAAIPTAIVLGPLLTRPNDEIPGYGARMEGSPFPGEHVAKLFDIYLEEWDKQFGNAEKARPLLDRLDIFWVEGTKFTDQGHPYIDKYGQRVAGELMSVGGDPYLRRGKMMVVWSPDSLLWQSAIAHELSHGFLQILTGDPGVHHLSDDRNAKIVVKDSWTVSVEKVISETNRRLSDVLKSRSHSLGRERGSSVLQRQKVWARPASQSSTRRRSRG